MKKIIIIILVLFSFGLKAQNDLTRSQVRDSIQALGATVSLSDLKTLLDDNFAVSGVFKSDVIKDIVAAANVATVDFDTIDTYELDAGTVDVAITVSNLQDGQIGWVDIINKGGSAATWANATDITPNIGLVNGLNSALYMVYEKNNTIYALAFVKSITTATTSNSGILEVATTAEAQALASDSKIITPDKLNDVIGTESLLRTDTITIGDWNMNISASGTAQPVNTLAHGITFTKIMFVGVTIIQDGGATVYNGASPSSSDNGVNITWNSSNIELFHASGGRFDGTNFNATSFNRGFIIIWYLD